MNNFGQGDVVRLQDNYNKLYFALKFDKIVKNTYIIFVKLQQHMMRG